MYEYRHGGNVGFAAGQEKLVDLSANINPLGMPRGVRTAIIHDIPKCEAYPDSLNRELRTQIGLFEAVDPDWLFCGNGASDIIFRLPRAVQAKKVLVTAPAFSDYLRSCQSYGAQLIEHRLTLEKGFRVDDGLIAAVRHERPSLVFLCNPNNPTGVLTRLGFIQRLVEACQSVGARLVVDECFLDFTQEAGQTTSKGLLARYPNLVILKAFTKVFALPGIRLGYAMTSDRQLIDALYFHGADWPVSNLAQAAGLAALSGARSFIHNTVTFITAERELISKELAKCGFQVFDSAANYLFFKSPYAFDLARALEKDDLVIRSCSNYHGLDDSYYRVAVSTRVANTMFVAALTAAVPPSPAALPPSKEGGAR